MTSEELTGFITQTNKKGRVSVLFGKEFPITMIGVNDEKKTINLIFDMRLSNIGGVKTKKLLKILKGYNDYTIIVSNRERSLIALTVGIEKMKRGIAVVTLPHAMAYYDE